jgi:outer membrane receptor for ferrienterochelin and colicins
MIRNIVKALVAVAVMALVSGVMVTRAEAQKTPVLHGSVVDANTHEPLEGAEIVIVGTGQRTRSGTNGTWQLPSLSSGRQVIRARRIGYSNSEVSVTVTGDATAPVAIALAPSARGLDAVVVTASRRAQRLQDAPVMMKLIDRKDIEQSGASDVGAVLTEQTGIQFTGGHPSGSGVGLEGMSDQRVLILVDGVPLYGRIADGLDITRVPSSAVERIEVVKGPQSTLYGSEAMGGVVNIITRKPGAGVPPNLEASVIVGSDNRTDVNLYGTAQLGPFATSGNLGTRHVDLTPGIPGSGGAMADRRDGMGSIRWTPNASLALDASTLIVNERQRWPSGGAYDFADNTQANVRLGATWVNSVSRLTSTLALSQLDHLSRTSQYTDPIAGTGDKQLQRLAQADVLYSRTTSAGVFDFGSQIRQEYIMSTDGRIAGGPQTIMSAEPYAQAEWTLGRWSIVPGVRLAWSEQYGTYMSPRIATRFRVDSSLTLRASVGRGFRAPDFKELYLDFSNDAAFYAVHGNPDLRPEHSDNVSAGAEWTGKRAYARTQLYWNGLRDFIETQPLANSGQFAQYTYGNIAKSSTRGVETETGITLGAIHGDVGYAYLSSRDFSTDGPLLGQPAHSGRVSISGPLPLGITASAIDVYTGRTPMERAADGSISSSRDAYNRIDLHLVKRSFGHTDLSVGVDNLFDTRPAQWANPTARQVYAGITWHAREAITNNSL